jgi:glycosyltransferase involved in cell wall biosynthesis
VSHKSLLVPTAHDEPPIYLSLFNELFSQTKGFVFSSPEEKLFLKNKFDIDTSLSDVIGVGIRFDPTIGRKKFYIDNLPENYVIYVGPIDGSKGCPQLFDYWGRFKAKRKNSLQLVLVGRPQMKVPSRKDIVSLRFLSEEEKFYVIAGARCLIMPSFFESLSIVLLEAWLCGRPVLVTGKCDVLKGQCRRSNGGLWYENYDEFEACLNFLLNENETALKMAANGKRFVESHYSWDQVKAKYIKLIDRFLSN